MRLARAVLFVALTGSWALADEVKPADPKPEVTKKKVPYRVVKTLPETGQVLLFDKVQGSHVVAELGEDLDYGFTIDEIDDDEVTLLADNGTQVILAAPPPPRQPRRVVKKTAQPVAATQPTAPAETVQTTQPAAPAETTQPAAPAETTHTTHATHTTQPAAPTPTHPVETAPSDDPVDPYGPVANGDGVMDGEAAPGAPVDPYGVSSAPVAPDGGGVRVATAAPGPDARSASPGPSPTPVPVGPTAALPDRPGTTPAPADPYGHPGIAAFAEAVGAAPEQAEPAVQPTQPEKAARASKKKKKSRAAGREVAATGDDASALAALATGTPPATSAPTTAAPTTSGAPLAPAADVGAGATTLGRGELDAALADFGKLAATFRATFIADGLRFDTITAGTLLTKIGLRRGDVVTHVDGRPLRTLDDAANLYARAGSVRASTIQISREGKPVTLRVAIQ